MEPYPDLYPHPDRDLHSRLHTPASSAIRWLQRMLEPSSDGSIFVRWIKISVNYEPLNAREQRRLCGLLGRPFRGDVDVYSDGFIWTAKKPCREEVDGLLSAIGFVEPFRVTMTPEEIDYKGQTWQGLPVMVWTPQQETSKREYWGHVVSVGDYFVS